jgi:hypothetical protein
MTPPIRTGDLRALPTALPLIIALGTAASFVADRGAAPAASADTTSTKASPPTTSPPCQSPNYKQAEGRRSVATFGVAACSA